MKKDNRYYSKVIWNNMYLHVAFFLDTADLEANYIPFMKDTFMIDNCSLSAPVKFL